MIMLGIRFWGIFLNIYLVRSLIVVPLLENTRWTLRNSNKTIFKNVSNPSGIYTDLRNTNVLKEDLFYRFNDVAYRWVANDTWTYSLDFTIDDLLTQTSSQELLFHGLDGISDIYLNKRTLGQATNSFIRYRFDVTNILQAGNNRIEIEFQSPIKSGITHSQNSIHSVPPSCVPSNYHGECHVNFLRRMQASFAWDWGPAFPSVGFWKGVELIGRQQEVIIRDVVVRTIPSEASHSWKIIADVYSEIPLTNSEQFEGNLYMTFYLPNAQKLTSSEKIVVEAGSRKKEIVTRLRVSVPKDDVQLWWPNGYGDQRLYKLSFAFISSKGVNTTKSIRIGFRTIKLVQDFIDKNSHAKGRSFYFVVNDIPIFAKGSNYIPANALPEKSANKDVIRELLLSAKITHMNMLRVWGGGIYESDYFYQVCDEYGIMIWQDMMFACGMYPVDGDFLHSVTDEITQQVRRLQYHASIVVWAGNNENEAALSGNWYGTSTNYSLYAKEYIELYVNTVQEAVLKMDNTRDYLVSSPTNGVESLIEGYISSNPYNPLYGDVHYYNYFRNSWHVDHFPFTRFSSEYGYQSLPSLSTWRQVATDGDLASLTGEFMEHRQHLLMGNTYLMYGLLHHFPAPLLSDLENIVYLTQINQAWSVKSQTEWYRKWRSTILDDGSGQTMGALFWQLNDIWQAPSWSSIEYGGKWKMLMYFAAKFFAPVLVAADHHSNGSITINVMSDLLEDIPNVILKTQIFKWNSLTPVDTFSDVITINKESAQIYKRTTVGELIDSNAKCRSDVPGQLCFLKVSLAHKSNNSMISENYLFPVSFKTAVGIPDVTISASLTAIDKNECEITLTTNAISLFVWLDAGEERVLYSDNGFIMTEPRKVITAYTKKVTCDQLANLIEISVLDRRRMSLLTNPITDLYLATRKINPFQ
ncbi:beta-mannosidase [Planococcus citri]|uniref:beta-mannosidase n=1 Tax=Planococcus citri TaxID=170843 RepID=UPI0031F7B09B